MISLRHFLKKPIFRLLLISILLYLPTLLGPFVWDDEQFIYKNKYVQQFAINKIFTTSTTAGAGVMSNYYRPLTTLSFALDYQIWQNHPFGFRFTNLLLHAGAALFLFLFLKELTGKKRLAWWLGLFFVIHPLQVESVAYINSRGDSLYVLCGMLGLWLWLKYLKAKSLTFQLYNLKLQIKGWWLLTLSISSFVMSVLAKEIGIALIGIYGLTSLWLLLKKQRSRNKLWLSIITGMVILSSLVATYLWLRLGRLKFADPFSILSAYDTSYSQLWVRLITFSKIFFLYLKMIIWPWPLYMERTTQLVKTLFSPYPLAFILLWLLILVAGYREFKIKHTVYIWFGSAWFGGLLIPVSGIIPVNGLLYQHWLYLPLVGFLICFYGFYQLLIKYFKYWPILRSIAQPINQQSHQNKLVIIAIVWSILSFRQIYFWIDPIRLYTHIAHYSPTARIYNNLGMELAARGQMQQAIQAYQTSLKISQAYPQTYHNLANIQAALGENEAAIKNYKAAIKINPNFFHSYLPLISLLQAEGQTDQAVQYQKMYKQILNHNY